MIKGQVPKSGKLGLQYGLDLKEFVSALIGAEL